LGYFNGLFKTNCYPHTFSGRHYSYLYCVHFMGRTNSLESI